MTRKKDFPPISISFLRKINECRKLIFVFALGAPQNGLFVAFLRPFCSFTCKLNCERSSFHQKFRIFVSKIGSFNEKLENSNSQKKGEGFCEHGYPNNTFFGGNYICWWTLSKNYCVLWVKVTII